MPKNLTFSDFVKKSRKIHGNKYDYSKVDYVNNTTDVTIICSEHGEFKQKPKYHMLGNGCPICGKDRRVKIKTKTIENFIEQSNKIHNHKYDYSKVEYKNAHTKVCIICPEHGEFKQTPSNHLNGQGCPYCGNIKKGKNKLKTQEEFIKQVKLLFPKYDYSKVKYKNNHEYIKVICPKHGEFKTKPNWLLLGHGCSECAKTLDKTEKKVLNNLRNNFSNVEYQKKFPFLKSKTSYQTIDFYLPDYNVGIEYQGRQHFIPIKKFGGDKNFKLTTERDLRKYKKCKENNIKIYYITFEKVNTENYFEKVYVDLEKMIQDIKYENEYEIKY